jgi:hypothetical protein
MWTDDVNESACVVVAAIMVPKASKTNYYTIDDANTLVTGHEERAVQQYILWPHTQLSL